MTKSGIYLRFFGPTGWTQFHEENKVVYHGPNREELIVSGTLIVGQSSAEELNHWKQVLLEQTFDVAKKSAAHPDLKIIRDLSPDPRVAEFESWTMRANTVQGDIVFYQSVICHQRGVVLITFEAPNVPESEKVYDAFLKTVQHN